MDKMKSDLIPVTEYREMLKKGKVKPHQPKKKGNGDKAKAEMELVLKLMCVNYESECLFHPTRKWRFDWAIPEKKIGIEYEGVFSEKSRHTTKGGYTADVEKYREAAKLGWTVLRYTNKDYRNLTKDLREVMPSGSAMYCSGCGKLIDKQDCACPDCGSIKFETAIL